MTLPELPDDVNAPSVHTIRVFTGRYVDPWNLAPDDVSIVDIAHGLARQCRFGGHVNDYYSVAEHSVWVAQHLWLQSGDAVLALRGLFHDATEAYLVDIPRPIKRRPEFAEYRAAEDRAGAAIFQKLGLPWPLPAAVHKADQEALLFEMDNKRDKGQGLAPRGAQRYFINTYQRLVQAKFAAAA